MWHPTLETTHATATGRALTPIRCSGSRGSLQPTDADRQCPAAAGGEVFAPLYLGGETGAEQCFSEAASRVLWLNTDVLASLVFKKQAQKKMSRNKLALSKRYQHPEQADGALSRLARRDAHAARLGGTPTLLPTRKALPNLPPASPASHTELQAAASESHGRIPRIHLSRNPAPLVFSTYWLNTNKIFF